MKELANDTRNFQGLQRLKASNGFQYTKVSYIADDDSEKVFSDAAYPIKIVKKSRPPKYANINYNPAAATVDFRVINENGEYSSKNTASANSGILVRDRIFKFYQGLEVDDKPDSVELSGTFADAHPFFMDSDSSIVAYDGTNAAGNALAHFADLFSLYGTATYGTSTYSPRGYIVYKFDFDTVLVANSFNIVKLKISTNSNKGRIYYRFGNSQVELEANNGESDKWTFGGSTQGGDDGDAFGTVEIDINCRGTQAIQIGVISFANTPDSEELLIFDVSVVYRENVEWVLQGTFFLDDPNFGDLPSDQLAFINVTGRNSWKKALETEINLADLSGGVTLDALIKTVADLVGIVYTASSIADLSSFGNRVLDVGYGEQVKADRIFKDIMQIIGATYRMRIDDSNILFVDLRPTDIFTEFVFNYKRYIKADQRFVGERQLQRLTMQSKSQIPNETETLDSGVFTTSGDKAFSWSLTALFKFFEITAQTGTLAISAIVYNNTTATFTLTGSGTITITIKGNRFATDPTFSGESGDPENQENKDGFTSTLTNPLLISDAESKTIAENFVTEFGDPAFDVIVNEAYLNLFIEINDPALIVSANFFEQTIYDVVSITYNIQSETKKSTTVELLDTGKKFTDDGAIIYDRNLFGGGANIDYDTGVIYDSGFKIGITREELDAQITLIKDLDPA